MAADLAKKLKLKPGFRAALVGAPAGYVKELGKLPTGAKIAAKLGPDLDWIQLFVKDRAALESGFPKVLAALGAETLLWISFPKGTSKIQTDLTRDKGWDSVPLKDLKWITLVSVNDTWSAFCVRPYRAGEPRQSWT